jgi:hypothetical protein
MMGDSSIQVEWDNTRGCFVARVSTTRSEAELKAALAACGFLNELRTICPADYGFEVLIEASGLGEPEERLERIRHIATWL